MVFLHNTLFIIRIQFTFVFVTYLANNYLCLKVLRTLADFILTEDLQLLRNALSVKTGKRECRMLRKDVV